MYILNVKGALKVSQTNINIRMDDNVKKQFDVICGELGLNMSTAFNIFAKTVVRQHRIPFELSLDPFYGEHNQERLTKTIAGSDKGNIIKTIEELEVMAADE